MGNFRHWAVVLTIWVSSCSPDQGKVRLRVNTPIPVKPPMTTLTPQNLFSLMNVTIGTECYQDQIFLNLEDPDNHQILQSTQVKLKTLLYSLQNQTAYNNTFNSNNSYNSYNSIDSVISYLQNQSSLDEPLMVDVFGDTQPDIVFSGHFFKPQDEELDGICDQNDFNNLKTVSIPQNTIPPIYTSGSFSNGRSGHSATLLQNGKILVVGGTVSGNISPLPKTEKAWTFDPETKNWEDVNTTTIVGYATSDHTATLLNDGKVLIVGGLDVSDTPVKWVKIYDPQSNAITLLLPTESLFQKRSGHSANLLPDGKVIVIGGADNGPLNSYELWDPSNYTWTLTNFPNTPGIIVMPPLTEHKTALLGDQLFVIGGYTLGQTGGPSLSSGVYIYDTSTNGWIQGPSYQVPIAKHTVNALPDQNSLIVIGGITNPNTGMDSVRTLFWNGQQWVWSNNQYNLLTNNIHLHNHSTTVFPNGSVLVVGGNNLITIESTMIYTHGPGSSWISSNGNGIDNLSNGNENHTATLIPGMGVFIFGGNLVGGSVSSISEMIRPALDALNSTALVGRVKVEPANLQNGSIQLPIQLLHTNPIPANSYSSILGNPNNSSKFNNWIEIPYTNFTPTSGDSARLITVQSLGYGSQPIEVKSQYPSSYYIPRNFPILLKFIYSSPQNPKFFALYETLVFDEITPSTPLSLNLIVGTESTALYNFPLQLFANQAGTPTPFLVKVFN